MNPLIEMLENRGLLRGSTVNLQQLSKESFTDLLEISEQSAELSAPKELAATNYHFTHTASISMSGGPSPCSALKCRMNRAHELTQFAALYSDCVYINNFLSDFRN